MGAFMAVGTMEARKKAAITRQTRWSNAEGTISSIPVTHVAVRVTVPSVPMGLGTIILRAASRAVNATTSGSRTGGGRVMVEEDKEMGLWQEGRTV